MSEKEPIRSPEREYAVWFGALLLDRGHVVELPNGRAELHLRTGNGIKKVFLSLRDRPVDRTGTRTIVGRIDELDGVELPHVIAILGSHEDTDSMVFVPVSRTRESWVADGRDYTVAAKELLGFDRLNAWLDQLGPCP